MKTSFLKEIENHVEIIKTNEEKKYNTNLDITAEKAFTHFKKLFLRSDITMKEKTETFKDIHNAKGYVLKGKAYVLVRNNPIKYGTYGIHNYRQLIEKEKKNATLVALHEIRHLLQQQKTELFSDLEIFLFLDRKFITDDELGGAIYSYQELDAMHYGYKIRKEYYDIENDVYKTGQYQYLKNMYDTEKLIDRYVNDSKNVEIKKLAKSIGELALDYACYNSDLMYTFLSSTSYLSNTNFKLLNKTEKDFLIDMIDLRNKDLNKKRIDNETLYINHYISDEQYDNSNKFFNDLIKEKLLFRDELSKTKDYKI